MRSGTSRLDAVSVGVVGHGHARPALLLHGCSLCIWLRAFFSACTESPRAQALLSLLSAIAPSILHGLAFAERGLPWVRLRLGSGFGQALSVFRPLPLLGEAWMPPSGTAPMFPCIICALGRSLGRCNLAFGQTNVHLAS